MVLSKCGVRSDPDPVDKFRLGQNKTGYPPKIFFCIQDRAIFKTMLRACTVHILHIHSLSIILK